MAKSVARMSAPFHVATGERFAPGAGRLPKSGAASACSVRVGARGVLLAARLGEDGEVARDHAEDEEAARHHEDGRHRLEERRGVDVARDPLHARDAHVQAVEHHAEDDEHGRVEEAMVARPDALEEEQDRRRHDADRHLGSRKRWLSARPLEREGPSAPRCASVAMRTTKYRARTSEIHRPIDPRRSLWRLTPIARCESVDVDRHRHNLMVMAESQKRTGQHRRVPEPVQLVRRDDVQRAERRLVQRRQQHAEDDEHRRERVHELERARQLEALEHRGAELEREHRGRYSVTHHATSNMTEWWLPST